MENGKKGGAPIGGADLQDAGKRVAAQAQVLAGAAKQGWGKAPPQKKKKIIAVLVSLGVLWLLLDAVGLKGVLLAAGLACCGWLVLCAVKKRPKKLPIVLATALLAAAMVLPGSGGGGASAGAATMSVEKTAAQINRWLEEWKFDYRLAKLEEKIYRVERNGKPVGDLAVYFGVKNNKVTEMQVAGSDFLGGSAQGFSLMIEALAYVADPTLPAEELFNISAQTYGVIGAKGLSATSYTYRDTTYHIQVTSNRCIFYFTLP